MNKKIHGESDACQGRHCAIHHVDEPRGAVQCGECGHSFATEQNLLDAHNASELLLSAFDGTVARTIDNPARVFVCPFCAHDL